MVALTVSTDMEAVTAGSKAALRDIKVITDYLYLRG
jgi:hypothetical protein